MVSSVFYVIAACLIAQCLGDTNQEIDNTVKALKEQWEKTMGEVKKEVGLSADPTGAEIVKVVKQQNEKMAGKMKEIGAKVEQMIKENPLFDADDLVGKVKERFTAAEAELRKERPEVTKNAAKLVDSMKDTWNALATEMDKDFKEFNKKGGKRDELEEVLKNMMNKGAEMAKEIKEKVDKALEKKA